MKFFEEELRKYLKGIDNRIVYVGNSAYIFCGDERRIKVSFARGVVADTYDGLLLTALDKKTAELDKNHLYFSDVFSDGKYPCRIGYDSRSKVYKYEFYIPYDFNYLNMTSQIAKYNAVFE